MVRTCPCHGHGRGSTPRRIVLISTHFVDGIKNPNYNIDMNIFVTDPCPIQSARNLPDKHIVKMPLETCQMLAIIYSDWYYGVGKLYKSDGTPYRTAHGAFRNHPCTQWAADNQYNLAWLIRHGYALCTEYALRYDKDHACLNVMEQAERIYHKSFNIISMSYASRFVKTFARAMPDHLKSDLTITTTTAYQRYLNTKSWVATNYLRIPSRKPSFIITTMTTSLPVYDFSSTPEERAAAAASIDKTIADAEAAMQVKQLEDSLKQDAPAVKAIQSKKLVPAKKATPKAKGKAGRIVGISAAENELLQNLLSKVAEDPNYATISANESFTKIQARYNK